MTSPPGKPLTESERRAHRMGGLQMLELMVSELGKLRIRIATKHAPFDAPKTWPVKKSTKGGGE